MQRTDEHVQSACSVGMFSRHVRHGHSVCEFGKYSQNVQSACSVSTPCVLDPPACLQTPSLQVPSLEVPSLDVPFRCVLSSGSLIGKCIKGPRRIKLQKSNGRTALFTFRFFGASGRITVGWAVGWPSKWFHRSNADSNAGSIRTSNRLLPSAF